MSENTLISLIRDFPKNLGDGPRASGTATNFISSDYSSINYVHMSITRPGARFLLRMRRACDLMWDSGNGGDREGYGFPLCIDFLAGDFGIAANAYMDVTVEDDRQFNELDMSFDQEKGRDFGKGKVIVSTGVLSFDPLGTTLKIAEKFSGEYAKIALETSLLERIAAPDGPDPMTGA